MNSENNSKIDESLYLNRRKKIIKQIKGEAALFISSAVYNHTRDQSFPHHQNSDFFYLTGHQEPQSALLLLGSTEGPRSILYLRDKDPVDERWHGERLGVKKAKNKFHVDDVRDIKNLKKDLEQVLCNAKVIHYPAGCNEEYDSIIWKMFCTKVGPRLNFPNIIKDARLLTSEMRFIKDRAEIQTIKHAVDITAHGILDLIKNIKKASSEKHCALMLESNFASLGADKTSFATIVASGKNSTVLHHTPQNIPIWKKELLLIDAGALYRGYCGDITRTIPASGKFSEPQGKIYDLVYRALQTGIAAAKPNGCLEDIHNAVVKTITKGLVELKLLKGSVSDLIESGAYKKFYMHRTGHWLGIDVHDISPISLQSPNGGNIFIHPHFRPLVPGNVFTIEPGIYIDPKESSVPSQFRGIGIRIEDDVLITSNGAEILSKKIPSKRSEIEEIMS